MFVNVTWFSREREESTGVTSERLRPDTLDASLKDLDVESPLLASAFGVGFGLFLLGPTAVARWGPVGKSSRLQRRLRAILSDPSWFVLSPARRFALAQFFGLGVLLIGIAIALPAELRFVEDVLMPTAIGSLILGVIAVCWPSRFVPDWIHDPK